MGRLWAPVALILALIMLAALPHAALAACTQVERHVTTTSDVVNPSDGVLSLREAIADSNADPNPIDCEFVQLPAGHYTLTGTLTITTANIVYVAAEEPITSSREVVIDGGGTVTLFTVSDTATSFQLDRLTLTNAVRVMDNSGKASVSRLTVSGNHADTGGAFLNHSNSELQIEDSTIVDNHATDAGGAIVNGGLLTIDASTLVGNGVTSPTGQGGAVDNLATVSFLHSTFNANTAASGADIYNLSGKTAQTQDSIYGSGCNAALTPVGAEGASFSSDGTCVAGTHDLRLGPLQDNGGPTDTEALLPGSPAIDAYGFQCLGYDQRDVRTPQGPLCDAGAYELVEAGDLAIQASAPTASVQTAATVPLTFMVSSLASSADPNYANDAVYPTLTDTLPSGLSFTGGSPGCSAIGQAVTCAVGKVTTTGPAVPVTIEVRADATGTFQATSAVSAQRPDVSPLDDQATITVTATAPPPPPPVAKVAFGGKAKVRGDRVRFTLICNGAPCSGDARILVKERVRHHHVVAVLAKTVALGGKAFTIPAGQRKTITLRLSKSGRKLRKRFRLPAKLSIRLGTPKTTSATAAIVFKRRR
jgi:hypothetical protein